MRCGAGKYRGTVSAGYWRLPHAPPSGTHLLDAEATGEPEGDLPTQLEELTALGLRKLRRILRLPTNGGDASLTRNQVTAAGIAVNAQLRADEQRLKAKVSGDVIGRLLAGIEEFRKQGAEKEAAANGGGGESVPALGKRSGEPSKT